MSVAQRRSVPPPMHKGARRRPWQTVVPACGRRSQTYWRLMVNLPTEMPRFTPSPVPASASEVVPLVST